MTATSSAPAAKIATRALQLSALAAIFWGTTYEATRIVLLESPPWTPVALRFALAAAAALLWLALTRGVRFDVLRRNGLAYLALGLIGVTGVNAALFLGMQSSGPISAALIMATSPLLTNLIEAVINRRSPARIALFGMAVSLIGVSLTVGAFSGASFAAGDLLFVAASLAWALYSIGCRRWVKDAAPLETTVWTMIFGAVTLVAVAFTLENPLQVMADASPVFWIATLHMALVGSVLAFVFWQVGIAQRGPAATSVLFNLVPVSALIMAAAFGRLPELSQILGVMIAIFGVWLASRKPKLSLSPMPQAQAA